MDISMTMMFKRWCYYLRLQRLMVMKTVMC